MRAALHARDVRSTAARVKPQPRHKDTLGLRVLADRDGITRASMWSMNAPKTPSVPSTNPNVPGARNAPGRQPLNPDPKSHPIHRDVPPQPLHEGTDPKQPVRRGGDGPSGAV